MLSSRMVIAGLFALCNDELMNDSRGPDNVVALAQSNVC